MESSSLVSKAKSALQNAAAKAERVLTEIKADIKADFGRASTPDNGTRHSGKFHPNLWFQYVPKKMKEQEFWHRYYMAVKSIRQEVIDGECENAVARSWSNLERRLSLRKDPLEEEAYKEAFSVVAIPPSMIVRRLAAAIEVGRSVRSMQELAMQGGRMLDRDNTSNSGDWSGLVSGFVTMKKLSTRDKDSKLRSSKGNGFGTTLLWSLFDADTQHEEREENKLSPLGGPKLPEEVHGAPPDSFVAQLAEIMAGIKTEQLMAEFWLEVIKELWRRWLEGQPISRMPVDANPELCYCLLHQQLQLINCCIARRKRRIADLAALDALSEYGSHGQGVGSQTCDNGLSSLALLAGAHPTMLFAKTKSGELKLRLGADFPAADLKMLETGEPVYSPITQENPVMTEDAIRETEELILRTRSVGAGCSQLLSDMQAFKAANPGCILEDFVRWYSPLDWREEPGSGEMIPECQEEGGEDMAIRGYLSVRMQCEGNLWQELWASAKPVPAVKQAPLFDEELAGESTLLALESLAPSDLFEQLFTAALSAGFAIADAAPAAKRDNVAQCLRECTDYIVTTCTRGMSTSKLEHLCEVYEVMETAFNAPLPEEPVEPEVLYTEVSGPFEEKMKGSPEPIKLTEFDSLLSRKSYDNQQATQFLKGENLGNIFSRIFEVKTSLFEKKQARSFTGDGARQPSPTVSGEWTFV
ncbi:unnamed protein product [Sphagnum jensenii]|uniref:BSD domain-containing protein n=1 Tax=Sphagnum jensenii TaxID=128206 RepID=A0ABP0X0P4_9BRYO